MRHLINIINAYITNWNHNSTSFTRTAARDEIITTIRMLHQDFKLLANNS